MSKANFFQRRYSYESAMYFCRIIADKWSPDEDVRQVMSALLAMAWAVDQLPRDNRVGRRLQLECASIACYLADQKERFLTSGKN
jgi:hypothetical protein